MQQGRNPSRKFNPGLGDLIDLLTVVQLRLTRLPGPRPGDLTLHGDILSDIRTITAADKSAEHLHVDGAIYLAHLNAEIWGLKEAMSSLEPRSKHYQEMLVRAHQLNGYRNLARNALNLASLEEDTTAGARSNTDPDGLNRWHPFEYGTPPAN